MSEKDRKRRKKMKMDKDGSMVIRECMYFFHSSGGSGYDEED